MIASFVFLLAALSPSNPQAPPLPVFGVVTTPDSGGCLTVRGHPLGLGDSLVVIFVNPPRILSARVEKKRRDPCERNQGIIGDSLSYYSIRFSEADSLDFAIGIAVFAPVSHSSIEDGGVTLLVRGDPQPYLFHECASMEGVHFIVKQGSNPVWHVYYYVPYDLEPTCTEEDSKDIEKMER